LRRVARCTWKNVLWPTLPGHPVLSRLGQAGSVLSALPILSALRGGGDPNEGRLSNLLGAAGGALGAAYGFPSVGILGAPMLARAGTSLGHGLGHLLGSRPRGNAAPAPGDANADGPRQLLDSQRQHPTATYPPLATHPCAMELKAGSRV
jgi:hypothetical protein